MEEEPMRRTLLATSLIIATLGASNLASAATAYVQGTVRMRAGPDDGYPLVRKIRSGNGLVVHGCLSDWSWCDAEFSGDRGWVPGDQLIRKTIEGRIPIIRAGAEVGIGQMNFNLDEYWDTHYNGRYDQDRGRWQSYYRDRSGDNDHR
jgi:uncharacterized protein YraI